MCGIAESLALSNAFFQLGPALFILTALSVKLPVSMLYVPGPRRRFYTKIIIIHMYNLVQAQGNGTREW